MHESIDSDIVFLYIEFIVKKLRLLFVISVVSKFPFNISNVTSHGETFTSHTGQLHQYKV